MQHNVFMLSGCVNAGTCNVMHLYYWLCELRSVQHNVFMLLAV